VLAITLLSAVVGGASLVVRFRRARGEERQQLRWVASAAVVAVAGIPVAMAGVAIESAAVVGVAVLGQDSSLAVAGATLAVAGAFQPLRRRIQAAVDRRFNRRRHDAARTIEAFSTRLRDRLDLDGLTAEVLGVVDRTMQPTRASPWLRPQASSTPLPRQPAARRP
jgi:hypothetical protein